MARKYYSLLHLSILTLFMVSCSNQEKECDATGTFEATEVTVSAKSTGELKTFDITEGQLVESGVVVGQIDAYQLQMTAQQLEAQKRQLAMSRNATDSRRLDLEKQLSSINQQISNTQRERQRFSELVRDGAVPRKQLDDINNQMPGASNKERDAMFAEQDINFNLPANFSLDVKPLNFSTSFNVNFLKQLGRNGKGELGFFRYTGTVVPPYLAYLTANFIIDDDTPSKYCMFSIDDTIDSDLFDEQPTSITTAQQPTQGVSGTFYDITGRPLPGKPSKPGVYIFKGKKIVIP